MSVWHDYTIKIIGRQNSLAKFFKQPVEDIRIEDFEISFGQKNGPPINLNKLIEDNSDLIFLVKETVECHTTTWWLEKGDKHLFIMRYDYDNVEVNKHLFHEYEEKFQENIFYNWEDVFNDYNAVSKLLDKADEYRQTLAIVTFSDIEFDNAPIDEE